MASTICGALLTRTHPSIFQVLSALKPADALSHTHKFPSRAAAWQGRGMMPKPDDKNGESARCHICTYKV